jgi:hypothetical protein
MNLTSHFRLRFVGVTVGALFAVVALCFAGVFFAAGFFAAGVDAFFTISESEL